MPSLPSPPPLPERAHGWLAQTLPVVASLASVGVLTAASGHALVAVVMIGATVLGAGLQLDHQLQSRRRLVDGRRRSYADLLAGLPPAPDWAEPDETDPDPICRLLATRHATRLREVSRRPVAPRDPTPRWARSLPHETVGIRSASGTGEEQISTVFSGSEALPPVSAGSDSQLRAELGDGVWLDLREAAAGGVGPHGVIVGATGSGKSELLRALVLSLALRLPPTAVTFLLVDFKGGTALGDLAALPHCAGLVTNLADSPALVARMVRALDAELDRRQRVVRSGAVPVPLVLVVDEFSELLTAHPEVLDVLVRIGRLGRSLGIHLVLASQRLDEARLRELDAHLSWRLALRTFTEAESRAALGVPEAARLPREPGWALLRTGPETPIRLRVGAAPPEFCSEALTGMAALAEPVPPIWLPPLTESPRLADLLAAPPETVGISPDPGRSAGRIPTVAEESGRAEPIARTHETVGISLADPRPGTQIPTVSRSRPAVPLGVIDDPVTRRIAAIPILGGHVAVVGCPGSGKSSLLATVAAGLDASEVRPVVVVDARDPLAGLEGLEAATTGRTVLLVDDWSILRQEHPLAEDALVRAALSRPGLRIVLAAHRWADVRPALRDLLETRIELRLADPLDSVFDRRAAAGVPIRQPGRGLFEGEHFVAARVSTSP